MLIFWGQAKACPTLLLLGFSLFGADVERKVATLPEADLKKGVAVSGEGPDFLWAIDSESRPTLVIDDGSPVAMTRLRSGSLWIYAGH